MAGKELGEMLRDADRPHPGAAAAVWNAKCLVQIQVANVRADVARPAKADLRVHVRAVHVNLAAVFVHDLANFPDRGFEDAVRGRVGDHERGQIVAVRLGLGAQIGEIDVAVFETAHRHDAEAGHDGAGRVGAVGGGRDETNVAVPLAARAWYSRMASRPAYSPCEPAFGCRETAAKPVISASQCSSCLHISR